VLEVLARIEAAVDEGDLPLEPGLLPAEREAQLEQVLSEYDE
jgi:hypothetical protein